jgi:hypothetical protein
VRKQGFVPSLRAMSNDNAPPPTPKKRHEYFRKFGAYRDFAEADAGLHAIIT